MSESKLIKKEKNNFKLQAAFHAPLPPNSGIKHTSFKGSVSREITGTKNDINPKVFLSGCVGRVIFNFLFRCHPLINIKLFSDIL
jgi:hypothetical protein